MSDPATRLFHLVTKWKKTSGGVLLAMASATGTFAWKQWTFVQSRVGNLETAQTQQYTQGKLQEQAVSTLSSDFKDFHSEYRQDVGDIRRALMIPPPRTSAASYKEAARIP